MVVFPVKKRTTVYLEESFIPALHACGIENISDFINRCCEETILLDQPDFSPAKQAKIIAEKTRKDILSQRKLIEEEKSHQEQAQEMYDVFISEAAEMFRNVRSFKTKLPEYDTHGDHVSLWSNCADLLSERCGFTVTEIECMSFVRTADAEGGI